jgi:hypothetical protein
MVYIIYQFSTTKYYNYTDDSYFNVKKINGLFQLYNDNNSFINILSDRNLLLTEVENSIFTISNSNSSKFLGINNVGAVGY